MAPGGVEDLDPQHQRVTIGRMFLSGKRSTVFPRNGIVRNALEENAFLHHSRKA